LKAYFAGSISNLGSHLVITLEAVNAQSGDTLARQQVEAESKEEVLSTLGKTASKLREKLGESLASIQKYDAPIEQATTSSLEALKVYSLGREQSFKGNIPEAISLYKRAIELDPNFALAYDVLAQSYHALGQRQLATEAAQKAFELRDRASQYEKLKIASSYYQIVTGEAEKAIEERELWIRTYPRDWVGHNNLCVQYTVVGRYEQAIEEGREAVRLNPNSVLGYDNLATALIRLNRFDEAKEIYEQGLAQKLDPPGFHAALYTIAFVRGDTAAMQSQLDWARGKPNEGGSLLWQENTTAYLGQWRRARELNQRRVDSQLSRNLKENAAFTISANALRAAVTGNCQQAREDIARTSALPRAGASFSALGLALALCGELGQAQSLADEYAKQYPKDTLVNAIWLPAIRAAIEIRRNNPAQAIQFLQSANRYDRVGVYWPEYLRGQAYLAQGAGAQAANEFQKILDRRGLAPTSVLYPLAHLGLARAAALAGDMAKARKSYQDFLALWKDADADLPILIEAKKEYEKLK
jgi:tetratricopeptide (TPR) repeat protein